jgi:hypothetical protein
MESTKYPPPPEVWCNLKTGQRVDGGTSYLGLYKVHNFSMIVALSNA